MSNVSLNVNVKGPLLSMNEKEMRHEIKDGNMFNMKLVKLLWWYVAIISLLSHTQFLRPHLV
jgi:hypothetical protein